MTKHTPGPWRLAEYLGMKDEPILNRENDGSFIVLAGRDEDTRQVAVARMVGKAKRGEAWRTPDAEGEANARLIAAAPELLTALHRLLTEAGEGTAKGRAIDLLPRKTIEQARAAITKAEGR